MLTQDVQYITQDEQSPCEKHIKGNKVKDNCKKKVTSCIPTSLVYHNYSKAEASLVGCGRKVQKGDLPRGGV